MPKNNFTFSKDYLDSIANAWIFSYQENQFIIQPDELLFGIYKFTKNHKFHAIFWSFFGLKDEAIIESYIQQRYEDTWKNISFKDVKFQLDSSFKSGFDEFSSVEHVMAISAEIKTFKFNSIKTLTKSVNIKFDV